MTALGSLLLANRGAVGVLAGQSNANQCGNNTGVSGLSKPSGGTWYKNGTLKASYDLSHHGPEQGILYEICTVAGKSCTLLQRGVDGTSLANWNATHCAALIADAASAGVVPRWGIWVQGEAEAQAGSTQAADWNDDFVAVLAKFRQAWGGGFAMVLVRIRTTDATNYTHHAIVRANQDLVASTWPHLGICHVDDSPLATDGSGTVHFTSATAILAGRRAARVLLDAGVIP